MRIPYRVTSGLALVSAIWPMLSDVQPAARQPLETWDPCGLVEQVGPMERIVILVFFVAFFRFVVSGLRNRSGPRWFAIAGLAALPLSMQKMWWKAGIGCYVTASLVPSFIWITLVAVMFLHHALRQRETDTITRDWSLVPAIVWLPIAWSCLDIVRWLWAARDSVMSDMLGTVLRCIGWAEIVMVPVAIGVAIYRANARQAQT